MSIDHVLVGLLPELAEKAREHLRRCAEKQIAVALTSGWRSPQEQMALYEKGREINSAGVWHVIDPRLVVTNAMPSQAPHCRGAAYDMVPIVNEKAAWDRLDLFQAIADCAHDLGLVWGGSWTRFKDMPHFELPYWRGLPLKEK